MAFLLQIMAAYVVTITAAILVEAPKSLLYKTGICGTIGYAVYLLLLEYLGFSAPIATLLSCMTMSAIAQLFARWFKAPVTIFLIPSFFTLVPGAAIYRTAFYLIQGDNQLMAYYFTQTLLIAGAIALGVYLVDSLLEIFFNIKVRLGRGIDE